MESRKQPYLDLESLRRSWRAGTKPAPQVNVVEWAEQFRKLSKESSNGGKFLTARVEVACGPMLWATEPGVSKLTLMACTQLLKTTVIENILGQFIHVETNRPEVWKTLESMFDETWEHQGGAEMSVRDWGIEPPSPAAPQRSATSTLTQREIAHAQGFTGDACPSCGGFMMKRAGTCLTCQACGGTTGCG